MTIPPDDLPRSPSGRVPKWVLDEAAGRAQQPTAWRSTATAPLPAGRAGRRRAGLFRRRRRGSRPVWEADYGNRRLGRAVTILSFAVPLVMIAAFAAVRIAGNPSGAADVLSGLAFDDSVDLGPGWATGSAPPPGHEEADAPLGLAPEPANPEASHAFLASQPGDGGAQVPVAWSPCRPVHYVVDTAGAPDGFETWVATAMAEVSAATGLVIISDGTTTELASASREPFQPDLYGERWAPALIRFADESAVPELEGRVAGLGGPVGVGDPGTGEAVYVSGFAYLDVEIRDLPEREGQPGYMPVLRHELGHLFGLAHVDNPSELMFHESIEVMRWQDGDLAGLAALGRGRCAPDV